MLFHLLRESMGLFFRLIIFVLVPLLRLDWYVKAGRPGP